MILRFLFIISFCILAISPTSAFSEKVAIKVRNVQINHYDLSIPSNYSYRDISPNFSDFYLIEIYPNFSKKQKLYVYFGNSPSFPTLDWKEGDLISSENFDNLKIYKYRKSDGFLEGLLDFQGLSYKGMDFSPYSKIHYFARNINEKNAEIFQEIIYSIKVSRSNLE